MQKPKKKKKKKKLLAYTDVSPDYSENDQTSLAPPLGLWG
jgi:hypothetical protein